AMSAPIEGEDVVAGVRQPRGDEIPGMRVLQEAVQEEDDGAALAPFEQVMAEPVGDEEARARRHEIESMTAVPAGGSMSTAVDSRGRAIIIVELTAPRSSTD